MKWFVYVISEVNVHDNFHLMCNFVHKKAERFSWKGFIQTTKYEIYNSFLLRENIHGLSFQGSIMKTYGTFLSTDHVHLKLKLFLDYKSSASCFLIHIKNARLSEKWLLMLKYIRFAARAQSPTFLKHSAASVLCIKKKQICSRIFNSTDSLSLESFQPNNLEVPNQSPILHS